MGYFDSVELAYMLIYRREEPKATIIMFYTGKIASTGTRSERAAKQSLEITASDIAGLMEEQVTLGRIRTENVVALFDVGSPICVEEFARQYVDARYEPGRFSGVICRLKGSITLLVFRTGKIVSVGSKSEYEARSSMWHAYRLLHKWNCILYKQCCPMAIM
jgi:transcription initiation factor TFIID TATA-box-binding protein